MKKIHRNVLFKKKIMTFPCVKTLVEPYYYYIAQENKLIDKNEIESSRIIITRELRKIKALTKKKKNFWINIHFLLPYTKKSAQSRMGKGKGAIDTHRCFVYINTIIFKIRNITQQVAIRIFNLISSKLSFFIHLYTNVQNCFVKVI
jgi:large subunit ribosomal protein L16